MSKLTLSICLLGMAFVLAAGVTGDAGFLWTSLACIVCGVVSFMVAALQETGDLHG
jgi:hypothetical protein